jgi:uncharacterized membrane protein YccC
MSALILGWRKTRAWVTRRRRELRLSVRVTVAALLTIVVAQLLNLPQGYWAVFAAVVVTETSVGGSVKTAVNWMIGTVGGAIYGAFVAFAMPHTTPTEAVLELVIGLAPLALLASLRPNMRVAPITAIIVIAAVNSSTMGPLQSAVDRVLEIGLGSLIGLGVSLVVLPARAHILVAEAACRALEDMVRLLKVLAEDFGRHLDPTRVQQIHLDILSGLAQLERVVEEARQERVTHLTDDPDPAPLPRTLHRVRNDLVMIGRAAPEAFPESLMTRLQPAFTRTTHEVVGFLGAASIALRKRQSPPSRDALNAALDQFDAVVAGIRAEQLTRDQPTDVPGRIFALSFAFEQLRANIKDLADRVAEAT